MNPLSLVPAAGPMLDRILVCLVEGTALAMGVTLLLRLVPRKNSRTRFVVWFSTLIAIAALPLLRGEGNAREIATAHGRALVTISSTWAAYLVMLWAAGAVFGLLRLAAGLWGLRRLRRNLRLVPLEIIGPELRTTIAASRRSHRITLLTSDQIHVPGAVGFLRPAILLPAWLVEDPTAPEFKAVVLHELAHLERWDDWSNLAQKLVKAVLFFHPGVWWIEKNLGLDREMACDDAVVARSGDARGYARSLARVAEKSFLRRQFALAQSAVDRMRQLSQRVASILDEHRPKGTKLWKPALPMVTVAAALATVGGWRAPLLVRISSDRPIVAEGTAAGPLGVQEPGVQEQGQAARASGREVVPVDEKNAVIRNTALDSRSKPLSVVPTLFNATNDQAKFTQIRKKRVAAPRPVAGALAKLIAAREAANSAGPLTPIAQEESSIVVIFATDQIVTEPADQSVDSRNIDPRDQGAHVLQIHQVRVWQVRWIVPANPPAKLIPRKT